MVCQGRTKENRLEKYYFFQSSNNENYIEYLKNNGLNDLVTN